MKTIEIMVDEQALATLKEMAWERRIDVEVMASRLLKRAIRAAQPRTVYDVETLRAYTAEFAEEDLALADSDSAHRLELLEAEDRA